MKQLDGAPSDHKVVWRNPVIIILCAVVLFFSSQIIGASMVAPFASYLPGKTYQLLAIVSFNVLVMYGLISTAMRLIGFSWKSIGWVKPTLKNVFLIVPAFAIYFLVSSALTALATKFIPGFNVNQVQDVGFNDLHRAGELVAAFVSLAILTPIFEETIFRGVLFRGLRQRLPFWVSAALTSLIFAVAHLQLNVAIDVFALSLMLCFVTEKSSSIVPGMVLHGLKNTVAFVLLFLIK